MITSFLRTVLLIFLFSLLVRPASAQSDTCPVLVQDALRSLSDLCAGAARNEACYGNRLIDVVARDEAEGLRFSNPGDVEALAKISSFRLSAMIQPDEWGVALMLVQANLPDTLPGQNVTMILAGDLTIEDRGAALVRIEVTSTGNINVRSGPGTGNAVLTTLTRGQVVVADGRNAAGDWLRIVLDDELNGWVSAPLVTSEGDLSTLAEIAPGADGAVVRYGPMQAFYFRSGIGEAQCAEAPPDGILLQTPAGAERITLLVNEARIELGSTVFLTANPGAVMRVAVVEGDANVTAEGRTVRAVAGTQAVIPLDEAGIASGTPELQPYDAAQLASLTVLIGVMPQQVPIAEPPSEEELVLLARGSLTNDGVEICAEESVTFERSFGPPSQPNAVTWAGSIAGLFTVRAGTTVTFTVGGETRLVSSNTSYYLWLVEPDGGPLGGYFERSTARTLTYTFSEDREFRVHVAGTDNTTVTLTVACEG